MILNNDAKNVHESSCNFGFEKSFITPDAPSLMSRGEGYIRVLGGMQHKTIEQTNSLG